MTPLDQAFAKAFSQRDLVRILPPRATRAVPLGEALACAVVRRVAVLAPVTDGQLDETLRCAPQRPEAKPSGSVPAPHFLVRRQVSTLISEPDDEMEMETEFESEPVAIAEPPFDQPTAEPEVDVPVAVSELEPEPKTEPQGEPVAISEPPLDQPTAEAEVDVPVAMSEPQPEWKTELDSEPVAVAEPSRDQPAAEAEVDVSGAVTEPPPELKVEPKTEPAIEPEPVAVATPSGDRAAVVEREVDLAAAVAVVAGQLAAPSVEPPIAVPEEFSPALEVDHFVWPKVCTRLAAAAPAELDRIATELKPQVQRRKVVAVAAAGRGSGATSMLLCVAQRLTLAGVRTVAVDGDLSQPQLGQMLGLAPECGWEEVLAGREPLDEVLIDSVDDRLSVLPLVKCVGPSRDLPARVAQSLATLCEHYEAVLLNLGPPDDWWVLGDLVDRRLAEQIGLLVVVCDARKSDAPMDRLCRKARAAGIEQVMLVENFVPQH